MTDKLSFEEAKRTLLDSVSAPGTETLSVRRSLGRVLAQDLRVPRSFPDTRRSAVDGYAIRFGDGDSFRVIEVVAAGNLPTQAMQPGDCVAVMTGGTVPDEADCVVKIEDCEEADGRVSANVYLEAGALINEPGSEVVEGSPLLGAGLRIAFPRYPALFYAGIPTVEVYKHPRVGVLITGDELREVEDGPEPGKAFNTNQYILESILDTLGVPSVIEKRVPDDEGAMRQALSELADSCEVIVSSGAVSMGRYDYIKSIYRGTGFSLRIEGTGIRPGSPLMVAQKEGKLFFGMPGYPAAFLTNALLYLVPALKKASGRADYEHRFINTTLASPLHGRKGRLDVNRVRLEVQDREWIALDPGSQKTSQFLSFASVNGLVFLPETVGDLPAGSRVKALSFDMELT